VNAVEPARGARVIEELRGAAPGPTLIAIGAMHGNEPAGVGAARQVVGELGAAGGPSAGEVVALVGNVRALAAGRRYLARDLNRQWTADRVAAARAAMAASTAGDDETSELAELADQLDRVIARARGPVFVLDLHTTSAAGFPFAVVGRGDDHGRFSAGLPLPGIVGLEEQLEGVLSSYLAARGCVALAVEGGQSQDPAALASLEAVVRVALAEAGLDAPGDVAAARDHLTRARGNLPHRIEVVSRHEVRPEHGFRMEPGFANIQRAAAGTLLARDGGGEIRAPFDGVVLLPLYQPQGSDGFFFGRELAPGE